MFPGSKVELVKQFAERRWPEMPTVRGDFPFQTRCIDTEWIPISDGIRLAARIWLPIDAHQKPVPAILEYLPYRRDTGVRERDEVNHPYFAGHGYASVRVDIRGTGDSDGIMEDEYLPIEQTDAVKVIEWLAAQPWCTGSVGMIGISWGGFNGLQVAALRPEALKAIVTICSTDDRYADDVHYMGGCVVSDMLPWASTMLVKNAMPPNPEVVGDRWRNMWLERLDKTPPYLETWLSHQTRDDYWKQGSVCEDFDAITCAVYAVGGWYDAYTNAIPRMLDGLRCPRKGLIGPWPHKYPNQSIPGPRIGFLQECLRWWDYWLKGIDNGIMDEPELHAWILDSPPASASYATLPGYWTAHSRSLADAETRTYYLSEHQLSSEPGSAADRSIVGDQATGQDSGVWCAYGLPGDFPPDQRAEDGRSCSFTSEPLGEPLTILGFPEIQVRMKVDQPQALIAIRLCDVSPDGESRLISRGQLNLTHRDSHEHPEPLTPGNSYDVSVRLNAIGWRVPAGHLLRVSISPTYWPFAWPSPKPARMTVSTGGYSFLSVPVIHDGGSQSPIPFEEAEISAPIDIETESSASRTVTKSVDVISGTTTVEYAQDSGTRRQPKHDISYRVIERDRFSIRSSDPLSASARCERSNTVTFGDLHIQIDTVSTLTADAGNFLTTNQVEAFENGRRVYARTWNRSIPRNSV